MRTIRVLPSTILEANPKTNTYKLLIEAKAVPSMGYEILHVVPGAKPFASDLKATGTTLENAALRVVVDPKTGCITSLFDRKSNFESSPPEPAATSSRPSMTSRKTTTPGTSTPAPSIT